MLPSVASLKILREEKSTVVANKPMIGFGNPVFDRTLQTAERQKEAALNRSLTIFYRGVTADTKAIEKFAKVKAEPALVLSIPDKPSEEDNGLLTASEVAMLKLNADFVVLSACNTAAREKPGAEALSGLARAFFYAGAKSLVVSHWEVDSEATVALMDVLFEVLITRPSPFPGLGASSTVSDFSASHNRVASVGYVCEALRATTRS